MRRLLEDYEFELNRTKGSHHTFIGHVDGQKVSIIIPYRRPLQAVYVKNVLDILDEIEPMNDVSESDEGEIKDDE